MAGLIAASDDCLLVRNWGNNQGLYIVDLEKKLVRKLVKDDCVQINKVGEWVYYISWKEKRLYKINIDGSGRERLCDDEITVVCVVNEWIYYTNAEDDLYRIRPNGIVKQKFGNLKCISFRVLNGWIYCICVNDDDSSIYRMHTNGSNLQRISDFDLGRYGGQLFIDEGCIYCSVDIFNTLGMHKGLIKMLLDGSEKQYIPLYKNIWTYTILDGWIYYSNGFDNGKLYKMRINGEDNQSLSFERRRLVGLYGIHIIEEWVYYFCEAYDEFMRVKKNGDGYQVLYCDEIDLDDGESYIGSLKELATFSESANTQELMLPLNTTNKSLKPKQAKLPDAPKLTEGMIPLSELNTITKNTGLKVYSQTELDGLKCYFGQSENREGTIILVFQKQSRFEKMIEDEERWKRFQRDLYYADIRNDRSRGIVTIIYVLDSDASNIPIQKIESNLTYGRKYVFTEEETITFLNGIVKATDEGVDHTSPVQEWDRILGEVGLTGCLTETYLKRKVISYLEGEKFNADYVSESDSNELTESEIASVKWIRSLDTTGFRDFCFDGADMAFGQINLLYGANGSGKTSVLEAIEYALTSEVRRVKDFKVKMQSENCPIVKVYDNAAGVYSFNPHFSKKHSKEIERIWYGVPKGRTKTTLNENFNRFNSFDSEAAYKFIHETENTEASFSSMFGNLMFGEAIVNYEKNWLRYKKAFDDIYTELRDELNTALYWKPIYENSIAERAKTREQSADVERMLKEIRYKHIGKLPTREGRFAKLFEELSIINKYANKLSSPQLNEKSFKVALAAAKNVKQLHSQYVEDKAKNEDELSALAEDNAKHQKTISELQTSIQNEETTLERFVTAKNNWRIVQNVLGNTETIAIVDDLAEESDELDRKIYYVSLMEQNTNLTNFLKLDSYSRLPDDEISKIKLEVENLNNEVKNLESIYSETKSNFALHEQQTMELKKLAKSLLIDSSCPLCGYSYSDIEQLKESIEGVAIIDNHINDMILNIENLKKGIHDYQKKLERESLIDKAHLEMEQLMSKVPLIKDCSDDYSKIHDFLNLKPVMLKRKEEIIEKQSVLSSQGFSAKNINACLEFKTTDRTYLEYLRTNKGTFDEHLDYYIQDIQSKIDAASSKKGMLEKEIQSNIQKTQVLKADINKIEVQAGNLHLSFHSDFEQAIMVIYDSFSFFSEDMKIGEWLAVFNPLFDRCELVAERLENEGDLAFDKQQLAMYSASIEKLTPQVSRCAKAVQVFETMPTLSSFVEQSIRMNIQQISKYFRWMHHSGEFSQLGVDDGGLFAIRGYDNESVRMYQMSTGQRTSIAMAVMLALHMAAPTAPSFLLLDEPLAHMDDTQVLNVLDIYKSIAEQNTQIFFTTANGEMIRHFKECFRDSKFDYKEYEFIKRVNCPSEIIERSINDTPSIEDLTLEDLTLDFHQFALIRDVLRRNQEKLLPDYEWEDGENDQEGRTIDYQAANLEKTEKEAAGNFFELLDSNEVSVLYNLLYKTDVPSETVKFIESLPHGLIHIEEINEKALDYFGETIIENNSTLPYVVDEYIKDLTDGYYLLKQKHR